MSRSGKKVWEEKEEGGGVKKRGLSTGHAEYKISEWEL
jgi:hypothetical protein